MRLWLSPTGRQRDSPTGRLVADTPTTYPLAVRPDCSACRPRAAPLAARHMLQHRCRVSTALVSMALRKRLVACRVHFAARPWRYVRFALPACSAPWQGPSEGWFRGHGTGVYQAPEVAVTLPPCLTFHPQALPNTHAWLAYAICSRLSLPTAMCHLGAGEPCHGDCSWQRQETIVHHCVRPFLAGRVSAVSSMPPMHATCAVLVCAGVQPSAARRYWMDRNMSTTAAVSTTACGRRKQPARWAISHCIRPHRWNGSAPTWCARSRAETPHAASIANAKGNFARFALVHSRVNKFCAAI